MTDTSMAGKILFETDAFAATKEVWLKASSCLGCNRNGERTLIKRLSPYVIQITGLNGDVFAEFCASTSGSNKKVWIQL